VLQSLRSLSRARFGIPEIDVFPVCIDCSSENSSSLQSILLDRYQRIGLLGRVAALFRKFFARRQRIDARRVE
jgi:hypothetical protein